MIIVASVITLVVLIARGTLLESHKPIAIPEKPASPTPVIVATAAIVATVQATVQPVYHCTQLYAYAVGDSMVFAAPDVLPVAEALRDLMKVGEVAICGIDLRVSNVSGPSLDVFVDGNGLATRAIP